MKENREAYEQLAERAVQLLAAVANAISKASPEKLKEMEGNVERLLLCVLNGIKPIHLPYATEQRTPGDQVDHRDTSPQLCLYQQD
jgi:hypothetical protein